MEPNLAEEEHSEAHHSACRSQMTRSVSRPRLARRPYASTGGGRYCLGTLAM